MSCCTIAITFLSSPCYSSFKKLTFTLSFEFEYKYDSRLTSPTTTTIRVILHYNFKPNSFCWQITGEVALVLLCGLSVVGSVLAYQPSKRNMKKNIFLRRFPLSRFLAKTLRVNNLTLPWKNFSKNLSFEVDIKLWFPPLTFKLMHTTWVV